VLHEHLRTKYSTSPFNAIIDITGADELLYDKSPGYLKPDGVFLLGGKMSVTHGGLGLFGILGFILSFQIKIHWPRFLGGTQRKGVFHSANIVPESIIKTAALVEAGKLTGTVDTEYAMEELIKVRPHFFFIPKHLLGHILITDWNQAHETVARGRARGKFVINVQDISD
jgi:hypothetical protein